MTAPVIWINAGEASGDSHGAALMEGFTAQGYGVRFTGMGGPAMEAKGFNTVYGIEQLSLMGLVEVAKHIPRVARLFIGLVGELKRVRPAAVVLIDAPDFNFLVARAAYYLGLPVYYYVSPQVWAWRTGRVKLMRRYFRKIFCVLPFEPAFYAQRGVNAEYVGHPLLDTLPLTELDEVEPEFNLLGLMPGSRSKELQGLTRTFLDAVHLLRQNIPDLRVQLLRAPGVDMARLQALLGHADVEIVGPDGRYEVMRRCTAMLAASGTAVLEAALVGTPLAAAYTLSPLTYAIAKRVVNVPYVTLPNLIAGREVVPELLQEQVTPEKLAGIVRPWLLRPSARAAKAGELGELRAFMGQPGGARRAAALIAEDVGL